MQVRPRSRRQHDARPIVAGKHQRSLDRAGREHDFARAHLPEAFARRVRRGSARCSVTRSHKPDHVVREIAERRRARQQRDVGARAQRPPALRASHCRRRLPVDRRVRFVEQRAAELGLFVAQHHARPALPRPRDAAASPAGPPRRRARRSARSAVRIDPGRPPSALRPRPAARRMTGSYSDATRSAAT